MTLTHALTAALVLAAGLTACGTEQAGTSTSLAPAAATPSPERALSGVVLLDKAVNGCAGEQITVQVRQSGGAAASALVDSSIEGFDCVYRFRLPVPEQDTYQLHVDGQPVGCYPAEPLRDNGYKIGVIVSESVYGDPATGQKPRPNADFDC